MDIEVRIKIEGQRVEMTLFDLDNAKNLRKTKWTDRRDLSIELFLRLDTALKKSGISIADIRKVDFDCDSPYFDKDKKRDIMNLEELNSSGKCGFTAWQTGEIFAEAVNFALQK